MIFSWIHVEKGTGKRVPMGNIQSNRNKMCLTVNMLEYFSNKTWFHHCYYIRENLFRETWCQQVPMIPCKEQSSTKSKRTQIHWYTDTLIHGLPIISLFEFQAVSIKKSHQNPNILCSLHIRRLDEVLGLKRETVPFPSSVAIGQVSWSLSAVRTQGEKKCLRKGNNDVCLFFSNRNKW